MTAVLVDVSKPGANRQSFNIVLDAHQAESYTVSLVVYNDGGQVISYGCTGTVSMLVAVAKPT